MAKGKKRDKDKKEIDQSAKATASTSVSESQPSTSQPIEESEGLGLGGKSRKKKQTAVASEPQASPEPMSVCTTPVHTATITAPVVTQAMQEVSEGQKSDKDKKDIDQLVKATVPLSIGDSQSAPVPKPMEEESEGLGLGLGGRSRKKKQKAVAAESQEQSQPVSTTPAAAAPVPQEAMEVQEESEGLGLGLSKGKKPRKKNKPAQPVQSAPVPAQSAPALAPSVAVPAPSVAPPQYGPTSGQHPSAPVQYPPTQHAPASGQYTPAPGQYPPAPGQYAPVRHQSAPTSGPPAPFPGSSSWGGGAQAPAPSQGAGRGAGRWAGFGRGAPPPGAGPRPTPPGSDRGTPQRELPPPSEPGSQLAQVQQKPVATQPARPSLRTIPLKIPGGGSRNTKRVIVLTNYLPMRMKDIKVHRYDVGFSPDRPKKFLIEAYRKVERQVYSKHVLAFDQVKNCYSLTPLPDVKGNNRVTTTVEVIDNNDQPMKFEVSFKYTGLVDLGTIIKYMKGGTSLNPPTEAIQCVDVILKQGSLDSYVRAGRQYFMRPQRPKDLGDGLEMWTGLFQSAIFTSQPFINIDVAHKGFPRQQPLLQAISQDFRLDVRKPITEQRGFGVDAFQDFIKGLRVVAQLIGGPKTRTREFICNGIVDVPDKQKFTFTDKDTNQPLTMTVGEYFRKIKGYKINYPYMNCMWVGPKDKGIYFPMELLEVAYGQARSKQLNERQLSTMVREAATPPDIRKQKIEEVISKMRYSANPYFKNFGLEISEEFFRVESKLLEPPKLDVGQGQGVVPRNGVWQANSLLKPEALEAWGFIGVDVNPHESNYEACVKSIMDVGSRMGMRVSPPRMQQFNVRPDALQRVLLAARDSGLTFLFVVISKRGRDTYQRVKKIAECNVGILTQCIKEQTAATRMNQQTARNILLKVNSKLMGVNQALHQVSLPPCLRGGDVMVVGADVTHPSPDQRNIPSIAAVTASLDPKCFIYNIELSIQTPKEEMIMQFEDMMFDHFVIYRSTQGKLPRKVFVYRDGVSEGQFAQVMQYELTAIHKAYDRLTGGKTPKLEVLFLLVQKRHHTRFFMTGNQAQYNVSPGTVVDTHIVHPTELDFYLVSHQAIKGTARPTRYHAICNDGRIPDEEVQHLTYYLCHLYSRCTRAVSYPTPTYYAHLACLRAKSLTYDQTFVNHELEKNPKRLRVLEKMLQFSRMFFV